MRNGTNGDRSGRCMPIGDRCYQAYSLITVSVSPARASRALTEDAISVTSPVCRLPAFMNGRQLRGSLSASGSPWLFGRAWISPCTDKGQASQILPLALIRTHPSPHAGRMHKVLEGSLKSRSVYRAKPYSIYTTKRL